MTPEMWTVIGVGIALATVTLASNRRLEASLTVRIERLEAGQMGLRERRAHLEELLEGLREAISGNRFA